MKDIAYEQALIRHQQSRGDLSFQQHDELLKIVGFRNVLVHDYLDINDGIVQAIITQRHYAILEGLTWEWRQALELLSRNHPKTI